MQNQDDFFFECLINLVEYAEKEYLDNDNNILHLNSQDYADLLNFTNDLKNNFLMLKESLSQEYIN